MTPTEPPGGIQSLPTPGGPGGFLTDPGFGEENAAVGPGHPDYEEGTMTALPGIKTPPGWPDPINTPYQRNEDLDLTNRANVMQEYKNWRMGGHGSRAHTMDMRGGMQFMGEEMAPGSSTGFGDFRKFLDTFDIGDRLQGPDNQFSVAESGVKPAKGIASLAQNNQVPGMGQKDPNWMNALESKPLSPFSQHLINGEWQGLGALQGQTQQKIKEGYQV